jgi:hypothetical protein
MRNTETIFTVANRSHGPYHVGLIHQRVPFVSRLTGNAGRINLRMEERRVPQIHEPTRPRLPVSTFNRNPSTNLTTVTLSNEITEPISPPPPLPPRNTTFVQRNSTTVLTFNNREEEIFQLPPHELTPVLARNSMIRSSRSSQFVRLPQGFLDFGLGTSQFLSGRGNRLDLFPWLHGGNIHPEQLGFNNYHPENDLPPTYEEAMKMKAKETPEPAVPEYESTDL